MEENNLKENIFNLSEKLNSLSVKGLINDNNVNDLLYYLVFKRNFVNVEFENDIINKEVFLSSVLGNDYKIIRKILTHNLDNKTNFFIVDLATNNNFDYKSLIDLYNTKELIYNRDVILLNYYKTTECSINSEFVLKNELFPITFVNNYSYYNFNNINELSYLIKYSKLYPEYFKLFREGSKEIIEDTNYTNEVKIKSKVK